MKKILTAITMATALLLLGMGCQQNVSPSSEPSSGNSDVSNNLSSSNGNDEVQGTYTGGSAKVEFKDGTATIYTTGEAASANIFARTANPNTPKLKYNYSYNSETKTLELQLSGIWDKNAAAINYDAQVQAAEQKCTEICTKIKQGIDENTEFSTLCTSLNGFNPGYGNTVKNLVKSKVDDYIENQKNLLKSYLKSKYNSVIKMSYNINAGTLMLSQIFQNNLSDASSEFKTSDGSILLNGYADLKPFSVTLGTDEFVGIPVFDNNAHTVSVDLYQYLGNVLSDDANITTMANEKVTQWMKYIYGKFKALSSSEKESLAAEATAGKTDTIAAWIDDELASLNITASYITTGENPTLSITTTKAFTPRTGTTTVPSGTKYNLNYVQVLSHSIAGVALTKNN